MKEINDRYVRLNDVQYISNIKTSSNRYDFNLSDDIIISFTPECNRGTYSESGRRPCSLCEVGTFQVYTSSTFILKKEILICFCKHSLYTR